MLYAAIGDAPAALVDLRSLRPLADRALTIDPGMRDLILSYDFYLVLREVSPQTPVTELIFPAG